MGIARAKEIVAYKHFSLERRHAHKNGDKVQLIGFGTFEVRERSACTGVKPGTYEKLEIPASKVPAFKAEKSLEDGIS